MGGKRGFLDQSDGIEEQETTFGIDGEGGIDSELEGQLFGRQTIGLCDGRKLSTKRQHRLLAPGDRSEAQRGEVGGIHSSPPGQEDQDGKGGGSLEGSEPRCGLDLHIGGFPRGDQLDRRRPKGRDILPVRSQFSELATGLVRPRPIPRRL